ncbi:PAS-domain containing protein [Xanthobacter autotrophicus]|uniref:sensor histidine kinase n=1 Tax=Xanthobacter TaxID=279 RepID=UPI0024AB9865|nr:PAS domain-containing sensor histidine kinase [Xanthobacter autotrophicus]MDI4664254.1 PAS-domain containing protein [Xanthobacter autotrophicus]
MADRIRTSGVPRRRRGRERESARLTALLRSFLSSMASVCRASASRAPTLLASTLLASTCLASATPAAAGWDGVPVAAGAFWPVAGLAAAVMAGLAAVRARREAKDLRGRIAAAERAAADAAASAARARAEAQACRVLLSDGAPAFLLWTGREAPADLFGRTPEALRAELGPAAPAFEAALARLKAGDGNLSETFDTASGPLRLDGRSRAGAGILLLAPASKEVSQAQAGPVASGLSALLDAAPAPAWLRGADGTLSYVNPAFVAAVGAATAEEARAQGLDLLDGRTRAAAASAEGAEGHFRQRVKAVTKGQRRQMEVVEVAGPFGTAGIAIDVTSEEDARAEMKQAVAAHRRTLDQLTTAVAIFGADERLVFHNAAYERLFDLSPAFLDQHPAEGEILEDLRTRRKVPEQADFRGWRAQLREAYRAIEPVNDWWHLPGGQMLRVVVTPNAEGGVTYLFDDLSEHVALESRYNNLIRIQGETLDGLAEAVAVFGSDGRLNLYNHAFLALWSLDARALGEKPHVDAVAALCRPLHGETSAFASIRHAVTTIGPREAVTLRLERPDGRVLDGATQPLPDGGTMVTFRDVTDSVKVERALIERAEALEAADKLKNAFVGHVSYHLRTPLNSLMGFADMLREGLAGPLNTRQQDYLDHMRQSSDLLRALIDDILDLASIDAGAMELDLSDVDVGETVLGVAEAVRDPVAEAGLNLSVSIDPDAGHFVADGRRVRQILFNLLSNAIAVSPPGGTVSLGAARRDGALVFTVRDEGQGVPTEVADTLFERFESRSAGPRHRGLGLGLAIVRSFMTLHGGSVTVAPAGRGPDANGSDARGRDIQGTIATCIFPLSGEGRREAAE